MSRPTSAKLGLIDDVSGACIGIRECVALLAARLREKLGEADRRELETILNLTNDIQEYHLALRRILSSAYQEGQR